MKMAPLRVHVTIYPLSRAQVLPCATSPAAPSRSWRVNFGHSSRSSDETSSTDSSAAAVWTTHNNTKQPRDTAVISLESAASSCLRW
jgi:hypothetical protein